jgi:hypothetical protein
MAELQRSAFTAAVQKDMYAYSIEKYDSLPIYFDKIFVTENSTGAYENETKAIGMGKLTEKKESEPIIFSNPMEGYTIYGKNRTFQDGIEFSMETVKDTSPDKIANIVNDFAATYTETYVQTKEQFYAGVFNYGAFTAGHDVFNASITGVTPSGVPTLLLYDGKCLFTPTGAKRPLYPGGTAGYYNAIASASLTKSALITAYNLMAVTNAVDSRGDKIVNMPDTILIPPALHFTVKDLLENEWESGQANLNMNVVKGLVTPIEWPYLTSATAWFLGRKQRGLIAQERMPLTFEFWEDPVTKGYKASVVARWGLRVNDWRYWVSNNASTS